MMMLAEDEIEELRDNAKVLLLEPYYGSIHKKLIETICSTLPSDFYTLIKMTPTNWHWRARTSALWMSTQIPRKHAYKILFCSSLLPLAELVGLRPDLADVHKFVYFHENHLESPLRYNNTRDYMCGYNQIMSCLAADHVFFNSHYNKTSFLSKVLLHLKLQPDFEPELSSLDKTIEAKSSVVHHPINIAAMDRVNVTKEDTKELQIVWPYKFESEENSVLLYRVIHRLEMHGYNFKILLLGHMLPCDPEVIEELIDAYEQTEFLKLGFITTDHQLYTVLKTSDVIVSAAVHEFFGVTVMEAIYCGCIPVVPRRQAFRELYGNQVAEMYDNAQEMYKILASLCRKKASGTLNRDYRYLATPYDSKNWFRNLFLSLDCVNFDE